MTMNPFTFGNPIRDPARFYGRKQEIRQIVNRLLSSAHESTSVVGERRIGKTSLLYHLSNPDVAASLGLTPDKYCLVYIDFQGLTDITPLRFWQRVLGKIAQDFRDKRLVPAINKLREQTKLDLFDLEDLFEKIKGAGVTVVLCMDEFEYVTQNPNFGADFFGGLRALAIHSNLALVPATRRELVDLCHSDEIKGSPFFNIFANVVLRPFTRPEADELVDGYTRDAGIAFTPEEKEFIIKLSGRSPFFIQMAGYYAVECKMQNLALDAQQQFVTANFDQQADPHHNYMWSHCSESEKITLLTIITLSRQKPSPKTLTNLENITRLHTRAQPDLAEMTKRGLLDEKDAAYSLFSPSFARWITLELTAPAGEEEKEETAEKWLGEWLKKEGTNALAPVKGIMPRFKKKYWPLMGHFMAEVAIKATAAGLVEMVKTLH